MPFVTDGSAGALDPRESRLQQRVLLYVRYGLRSSVLAARRCCPISLCDSSDTAERIDLRVSFCRLALTENLCVPCHCHKLLPFTCVPDFLSLDIVTCFAMSFALRSDAIARLVLCLALHSHAFVLCELFFFC